VRYREAIEASDRALQINAKSSDVKNARGLNYLLLGEFDSARQSCETRANTCTPPPVNVPLRQFAALRAQAAEAPLPPCEVRQCVPKAGFVEFGP
jgi:hypothetical protein